MIGLHGSGPQREADILSGLLALLSDPEACRARIAAFTEATQKHQATLEAAHEATAQAQQTLADANNRHEQVTALHEEVKKAQVDLDNSMKKLAADRGQLEKDKGAHAAAVALHVANTEAQNKRAQELAQWGARQEQVDAVLKEREEAVRKSEWEHAERARKLREIVG